MSTKAQPSPKPAKKTAPSKAAATELQIVSGSESASQTLVNRKHLQNEMESSAARLTWLQAATALHVGQLKILKFFMGIEVNLTKDLHRELYGETRGGGVAKEVPLMGTWVEERTGITERSSHRYHQFFRSVTQARPELAQKLIAFWDKWKSAKIKPAPKAKDLKAGAKPPKAQLAKSPGTQLTAGISLTQADLQELLMTADEWRLHELFDTPTKDVTPPKNPPEPSKHDPALLKFWVQDVIKRAMNNEFLKLPKQEREALLTTTEEMVAKLKDSLKAK